MTDIIIVAHLSNMPWNTTIDDMSDPLSGVDTTPTLNATADRFSNVTSDVTNNTIFNNSLYYDDSYGDASPVENIIFYINFVFVIIGGLGNSLTIIAIKNTRSTLSSTMVYLISLAVADNITLIAVTLLIHNTFLINAYTIVCKIFTWVIMSCLLVSSWILVAVTIERLISIRFPHKVKVYCVQSVAKFTVICIYIISYAINSHCLYGMQSFGNVCTPIGAYINFVVVFQPWVDIVLLFAVPFVTIFISNCVIIQCLYVRFRKRRQMNHIHATHGQNKELSVTVMLVVVCIVFLVCAAPPALFNIVYLNGQNYLDPTYWLWASVLKTLANVNAMCNFYLYFLSGQHFRNQVKTLFSNCKWCTGE